MIFGSGIPYSLALLFNNPIFGDLTKKLSQVTFTYGIMFQTFTIANLMTDDGPVIKTIIQDGEWLLDFYPFYFVLLIIYGLLTIVVIRSILGHITSLEEETSTEGKFEYIFGMGVILLIAALIHDESVTDLVGILMFTTGLVMIFVGIIFLFYEVLSHPFSTVYVQKNPSLLFDKEIVSWAFFAIREMGPELMRQSESLKDNPKISSGELFKFGVQTLMMAYNDNKYINNASISSFAAREDYFALSISFVCQDPTLRDQRFKSKLQSALIIILPTYILINFTKPLRNFHKLNKIIEDEDLENKLYSEINNELFLNDLSIKFIDALF